MCIIFVFFLFDLYGLWLVPTYSIPGGYVHNFSIMTHKEVLGWKIHWGCLWDSLGSIIYWEVYWWWFLMVCCSLGLIGDFLVACCSLGKTFLHWEKLSSSFLWLTGDWCWFHSKGGFYQLHRVNFILQLPRGLLLCPSMILNFAGDLVDDLDLRRSFLDDLWSIEGFFYAFNLLGMPLRVFVFFVYWGNFCHFECIFEFPLHFLSFRNSLGIFDYFFLLNYM